MSRNRLAAQKLLRHRRRPPQMMPVRARLEVLEPRTLLSGISFDTSQVVPTGFAPVSAAVADFDGDGALDVAVGNTGRGEGVGLSLNNGSGGLLPMKTIRAFDARAVTSGDFNGDGRPDLAVGNISDPGVVNILLNTGGGTFAEPISYSFTQAPAAITSADFDGDGKLDLALSGAGFWLNVMRGNGDGTFAAAVTYSVESGNAIAAADFTGDGRPDLAVPNRVGNSVSFLRNNGDGTFAAKVAYTVGTTPMGVTAGDFDKDGRLDLAVANSGSDSVSVMRNLGNGTFAAKVDYPLGFTGGPQSVTSFDVTGDGRPDLLTANETGGTPVTVFTNNGSGTFTRYASFDEGAGTHSAFITHADVDMDGREDAVLVSKQSLASTGTGGLLTVMHNRGDARIFASVWYTAGSAAVTQADFNGDGRPDVATVSGGLAVGVRLNQGGGALATGVSYPVGNTGTGSYSLAVADFDGDGKPDLAVAAYSSTGALGVVSVLRNNGDGTFAAKVDYATGGGYAVTAGDFDGDGRPDLAVVNAGRANSVSVLLNTGSGAFAPRVDYVTGQDPLDVAAGDFDGDGKVDLAVANYDGNSVSVLRNLGRGTFAARVDYGTSTQPVRVEAADVTGDGRAELVVAAQGGGGVSLLRNNGNGTFAPRVDYATAAAPRDVEAADFDGDGDADLAVANPGGRSISLLSNRGDGTFVAGPSYGPGIAYPYNGLAAADFNGDGSPDLAVIQPGFLYVVLNRADLAPRVRSETFSSTPTSIRVTFSEPVGSSLAATDLIVTPAGGGTAISPTSVTYDVVTNTARFVFATPLPDGNYRARITAGNVRDGSNKPLAADFAADFFVLAGDATGDRVVNFDDLLVLAKNYNKTNATYGDGDFTGDGVVNFDDLLVLAKAYNKTLAAPVAPAPAVAATVVAESAAVLMTAEKKTPVFSTKAVKPAPKPAAVKAAPAPKRRP